MNPRPEGKWGSWWDLEPGRRFSPWQEVWLWKDVATPRTRHQIMKGTGKNCPASCPPMSSGVIRWPHPNRNPLKGTPRNLSGAQRDRKGENCIWGHTWKMTGSFPEGTFCSLKGESTSRTTLAMRSYSSSSFFLYAWFQESIIFKRLKQQQQKTNKRNPTQAQWSLREICCYGLNVSRQNLYVETLTPRVKVFGGEVFGR